MCPVEAGGRRDPGGQAAGQGCGWLSGPLPFPATESEEGTQAGHQPCRFYQLLTGEGRAGERRKTQTTSSRGPPHRCQSSSSALGECLWAPTHTSFWPLPRAQQQGPLGGELHVSQNAAGHGDPGLFPPLWGARPSTLQGLDCPLYSSQAAVHTSHSHRQSLACQIQPLGEAMGRKISLPWLAFQSTYESAGIGEKHNCPRLGSLLFFAAERPSVWPVLEAPRCLRLWPQIIVILVGKAWGVQSVRLDCSTCAGQFCDLGQANLLL